MNFAVITENDVSQWSDKTGSEYHFPKRYAKYLTPGTTVVYYKGKLKDTSFREKRLSDEPHYFGFATIEQEPFKDEGSEKGDLFVTIENFTPFKEAVPNKIPGTDEYIEIIPENRANNYWRDGVRPISQETFEQIAALSGLSGPKSEKRLGDEYSFTSAIEEGGKKQIYSTRYERDPKLRKQAIEIHGDSCKACGFNFGKVYGEHGSGFIHIHHVTPISSFEGKQVVNPVTDLIPLCANCHAMVHRRPNETLSIGELKQILDQ
ncbi:HNH endonuclease [Marinobacter salsuginis]|uniref:HNH endonuclease n=1 Tax=Marinobacter salsuginis TaxID=418719 RepID=UPI001C948030|nr:HNH endonuclease [Marinobacter salsuginis]MBY6073420.1 HNH endonuclease [Marinobacter salsuginis]